MNLGHLKLGFPWSQNHCSSLSLRSNEDLQSTSFDLKLAGKFCQSSNIHRQLLVCIWPPRLCHYSAWNFHFFPFQRSPFLDWHTRHRPHLGPTSKLNSYRKQIWEIDSNFLSQASPHIERLVNFKGSDWVYRLSWEIERSIGHLFLMVQKCYFLLYLLHTIIY